MTHKEILDLLWRISEEQQIAREANDKRRADILDQLVYQLNRLREDNHRTD